ncbi:MAG: Hint domain-containing protein [Pseudomonadota bacterium]
MVTTFRGAFVISWSQTEVDGLEAAPIHSLKVGAAWSWTGDLVRVDGPSEVLRLERNERETANRKCAAKLVRRLVKAAQIEEKDLSNIEAEEPLMESGFVVTDGTESYTVTVIDVGQKAPPLLMFLDEIPPRDTEMWVVHHSMHRGRLTQSGGESGGVICFTPGTKIQTPDGARPIELMREGDYVQTKDCGAQQIQWIGSRRLSGARLFAMPHLRPVRIHAGALGVERPDQELLVSPEHRMLVQGRVAQALFNSPEVLVSAHDLINNKTVTVDVSVREVTYIHLLLPSHQILWANGVETESFHPASAALSALDEADRQRLLQLNSQLESEPHSYGSFARRNLSSPEAAILTHESAA